jgi:hypothetical protein
MTSSYKLVRHKHSSLFRVNFSDDEEAKLSNVDPGGRGVSCTRRWTPTPTTATSSANSEASGKTSGEESSSSSSNFRPRLLAGSRCLNRKRPASGRRSRRFCTSASFAKNFSSMATWSQSYKTFFSLSTTKQEKLERGV